MKKRNIIRRVGSAISYVGVLLLGNLLLVCLEILTKFIYVIEINGIPFLIKTLQIITWIIMIALMLFLGLSFFETFEKDSE